VNAVALGWIASTGMDHYDLGFINEMIPKMEGLVPQSQLGEEAEVGATIVFLLSAVARRSIPTLFPLVGHDKSSIFAIFIAPCDPKRCRADSIESTALAEIGTPVDGAEAGLA